MSINWGFIGAGMVAQKGLAAAVATADNANLYAVASRDISRARALQPIIAYDNYQQLIADPKVDAVYISLPNHLHAEWAIKSLTAGKAVLCEKPLAISLVQAEQMFRAAKKNNQLLIEAIWFRWHPRVIMTQSAVRSGQIGKLLQVDATFTFENTAFGNYRFDPQLGGGALLDLGVYPLHLIACLIEGAPKIKVLKVERNLGPTGVDLTTNVECVVNDLTRFNFKVSFEQAPKQEIVITGSNASITFELGEAFTNWNHPSTLRIDQQIFKFEAVDPYKLMIQASSAAIAAGVGLPELSQVFTDTSSSNLATPINLPAISESLFVLKSLDAIRLWSN